MDALDQTPLEGEPRRETLAVFIASLTDHGIGTIAPGPLPPADETALTEVRRLHSLQSQASGLTWPALSTASALWAAQVFYHLCRATGSGDTGMEEIYQHCRVPCPEKRCPETDASVDLFFRHLKAVHGLARHLNHADPLLDFIHELGAQWPLSSVGIPGVVPVGLDSFLGNPTLLRLYLDRVLEADDSSRLGDARVNDFLRADLGIHRQLAPAIAYALSTPPPSP